MNVKKGEMIVFVGYAEPPEEGMDLLIEGEQYEVVEVNAKDKSVVVRIDNPDFNAKKKESEENPKTILLDVFEDEFEVPEAAPAKARGKAPAKAAAAKPSAKGKAAAPEEDDPEPAAKSKTKATAKGKAAAPAKGKVKAKAKPEKEVPADPYADLSEEDEDSEILGLVNDAEDILELAKEVVEEAAATDYKLGGILFHVRKSGAYKELDKRYAEKGGFNLYVLEELNVEYRKAMYLIDIYYKTSKYGLDAERVSAIGWAKAAKIAAVMEEDNAEELLNLAEQNTVADLVENIKTSYKEVGATKGEKKQLKIFKFRLFEDKAVGVEEVLNSVASAMSYKTLDEAFEHIIMEWAAEHPVTKEAPATKGKAKAAPAKAAPTKAGKARA